MWPDSHETETVDLVTFTKETLNGKLYFLCSAFTAGWLKFGLLNEDLAARFFVSKPASSNVRNKFLF